MSEFQWWHELSQLRIGRHYGFGREEHFPPDPFAEKPMNQCTLPPRQAIQAELDYQAKCGWKDEFNEPGLWCAYIANYATRWAMSKSFDPSKYDFRTCMVKAAALAVAALRTIDYEYELTICDDGRDFQSYDTPGKWTAAIVKRAAFAVQIDFRLACQEIINVAAKAIAWADTDACCADTEERIARVQGG